MGSTMTKKELIESILKRMPEPKQALLEKLPMKDLWKIDRKLTSFLHGHKD